MTQTPQELAQSFISLWQEQLKAMSSEPSAAQDMLQQCLQMQQRYATEFMKHATSPSHLSPNGDATYDELQQRLDRCEERLAALEQASAGKGGSANRAD